MAGFTQEILVAGSRWVFLQNFGEHRLQNWGEPSAYRQAGQRCEWDDQLSWCDSRDNGIELLAAKGKLVDSSRKGV